MVGKRFRHFVILLTMLSSISGNSDVSAENLLAALSGMGCAATVQPTDHGRVLEEIAHARAWNARLRGTPLAAIDHQYFSAEAVLARIERWTPLIVCIAGELKIPPELLAGLLALELDLDYHQTDAVFDWFVQSPLGAIFSRVEIGAGYAGVHFNHLRPALATLGENFSPSPFYRAYHRITLTRAPAELTWLATHYRVFDLTNAAVMARYYASLRLEKPISDRMTLDDMAFIWSAYRGGIGATAADPSANHRWRLANYQKADNPYILGDTIIALPYFSHYREVFSAIHPLQTAKLSGSLWQ